MRDKFQNKYRIASARLHNWDYSSNGAYFITICTQNKEHYFGTINDGKMVLSEIGKLVEQFWIEIPNQFLFIELGNFVIMPNHVHGIIIINKLHTNSQVETRFIASNNSNTTDETRFISSNNSNTTDETRFIASNNSNTTDKTRLIASLQEQPIKNGGFAGDKNPMFHENISKIIRWYKGRCSFEIRKIHADFGWQSRFHDHIIRNANSFENIQNYIQENPERWENDKFFT
ncbi:transposase [Flavobacterium sp.]|uniref:transposase n=1 Tax=Flavobacterium sp. TaxID=239 RepID=UPI002B9442A7|nr:transposase [Flavobacterium sp.]HQA73724.1 transposase [Flavobacterium sp.]